MSETLIRDGHGRVVVHIPTRYTAIIGPSSLDEQRRLVSSSTVLCNWIEIQDRLRELELPDHSQDYFKQHLEKQLSTLRSVVRGAEQDALSRLDGRPATMEEITDALKTASTRSAGHSAYHGESSDRITLPWARHARQPSHANQSQGEERGDGTAASGMPASSSDNRSIGQEASASPGFFMLETRSPIELWNCRDNQVVDGRLKVGFTSSKGIEIRPTFTVRLSNASYDAATQSLRSGVQVDHNGEELLAAAQPDRLSAVERNAIMQRLSEGAETIKFEMQEEEREQISDWGTRVSLTHSKKYFEGTARLNKDRLLWEMSDLVDLGKYDPTQSRQGYTEGSVNLENSSGTIASGCVDVRPAFPLDPRDIDHAARDGPMFDIECQLRIKFDGREDIIIDDQRTAAGCSGSQGRGDDQGENDGYDESSSS